MTAAGLRMARRKTKFFNSRTFPGQGMVARASRAAAVKVLAGASFSWESSWRKWAASRGMSSRRSRKGRHGEGDDVDAVIEVFPEGPPGDLLFQVLVGGGHHPHVHLDGAAAAHPLEALLLQDAQDLGLGLEAHVADLIQKQGAFVGQVEFAPVPGWWPR